jgi:hypothetical protein
MMGKHPQARDPPMMLSSQLELRSNSLISSHFISWALQHNKEASDLFARSNQYKDSEEFRDTMTTWLLNLSNHPEAYQQTMDPRLVRQGQSQGQ